MEIGIVGLPYSGKSTLFATLLNLKADSGQQGKAAAERGIIKVPDERLDKLTAIFNPRKKINATIEFLKVPGLEGDGTSLYIHSLLQSLDVKVTRLARGLPTGSAIEFSSGSILTDAILNRTQF